LVFTRAVSQLDAQTHTRGPALPGSPFTVCHFERSTVDDYESLLRGIADFAAMLSPGASRGWLSVVGCLCGVALNPRQLTTDNREAFCADS